MDRNPERAVLLHAAVQSARGTRSCLAVILRVDCWVRNYHEPSLRSVATSTYSIANQAAEPVETPNMCKYKMSGSDMFYVLYFGTAAKGTIWLYYLTTMYPQQHFCDHSVADATVRHTRCQLERRTSVSARRLTLAQTRAMDAVSGTCRLCRGSCTP